MKSKSVFPFYLTSKVEVRGSLISSLLSFIHSDLIAGMSRCTRWIFMYILYSYVRCRMRPTMRMDGPLHGRLVRKIRVGLALFLREKVNWGRQYIDTNERLN
jgi:hypothetical protein